MGDATDLVATSCSDILHCDAPGAAAFAKSSVGSSDAAPQSNGAAAPPLLIAATFVLMGKVPTQMSST
jgi:hypothetical protein